MKNSFLLYLTCNFLLFMGRSLWVSNGMVVLDYCGMVSLHGYSNFNDVLLILDDGYNMCWSGRLPMTEKTVHNVEEQQVSENKINKMKQRSRSTECNRERETKIEIGTMV